VAGQPTKYRPQYCEKLITHMSEGFSYESFAGLISCSLSSLYNWEESHPEFLEAKKTGFEKNRLFYEALGIAAMQGEPSNSAIWIFNMKNRFPKQWRDKHDVESTNVNLNASVAKPDETTSQEKLADTLKAILNRD